ncbi:hypothetical protein HY947_00475 [Candidatus Gottesmanbacteria bacterium]|nr:hypothetical protein [Candidatus Gottesmanbacteria bacterium]
MGGPCDEVFEGKTAEEVANMGGQHIMSSTDAAHKPMREQMAKSSKEEKDKWMVWFKGEWDKK